MYTLLAYILSIMCLYRKFRSSFAIKKIKLWYAYGLHKSNIYNLLLSFL